MIKFNKFLAITLILLMLLSCFVACGKPHEHKLIYVSAKSADKYVHGNIEHYRCDCGALFLAANGGEVSRNEIVIRSTTGFDKQTYTNDYYTLNYCLYEPKDMNRSEDKVPLILFLHGSGECGDDNQSQLIHAIQEVVKKGNENSEWMNSVIIAPQCPTYYRWVQTHNANYMQADLPETEPFKAVAELVKQYANYDYIDSNRVYVVGLSMGGQGTWDILARYPDLFAAGVPICGSGPVDKIDVLKNIPIYTFHGTADRTVDYSNTQAMYNAITAAGGNKIIFYTFENGQHGIWNDAIKFAGSGTQYPALETWLFSQSK